MMMLVAVLSGVLLLTGVFAVVLGLQRRPRPASTAQSTGLWTSGRRRWHRLSRRDRRAWMLAFVAGIVAMVLTATPVMLVVVPAVIVALPALLRSPVNADVQVLEALDRWVRLLASSMPTGKSVSDAIRATARQAPPLLQAPVRLLVTRLDDRWTTKEALLAFADDLDSVDADAVVAALVLAAQRGGRGSVATLTELSDAVQQRLTALRDIEAEREKPRVVVRQITVVSVVVILGAVVVAPSYMAPLLSPVGQVVVVGCLVIHLGSLFAMRRRTTLRRRQRLLTRAGQVPAPGLTMTGVS